MGIGTEGLPRGGDQPRGRAEESGLGASPGAGEGGRVHRCGLLSLCVVVRMGCPSPETDAVIREFKRLGEGLRSASPAQR